jgi:hypothetical protein
MLPFHYCEEHSVETNQIRDRRQFWQEQVEQWQTSKLSKAAFCRQAALKVTTFYYWCKVFEQPEIESDLRELPSAFIPLELTRDSAPAFSLKVADVTLSCNQPVSSNQLRQWLVAIRSTL